MATTRNATKTTARTARIARDNYVPPAAGKTAEDTQPKRPQPKPMLPPRTRRRPGPTAQDLAPAQSNNTMSITMPPAPPRRKR